MRPQRPRALLVVPPVYDFAFYDLFTAPFGLVRIGRWLSAAGYDVRLVDALRTDDERSRELRGAPRRRPDGTGKAFRTRVEWPAGPLPVDRSFARYGIVAESFRTRIADAFEGAAPDVALVTSGMTYWYPGVVEAVQTVRAAHPLASIAVGGVYASLLPEHCAAATGADLVAAGSSTADLAAFLGRLGLPVPTGAPHGAVVDSGRGFAAVRLNEGCPYRCDYCASHMLCPRFEPGDPYAAAAEVSRLSEREGVRNFAFYDDALLVDRKRVFAAFFERFAAGGAADTGAAGADPGPGAAQSSVKFHLPNAVHMSHLDADIAGLMNRAGVQEVRLGFESDSDAFHAAHDAGSGPKVAGGEAADDNGTAGDGAALSNAVNALRAGGFSPDRIGVYVLAGLPGQRRGEVERSVRTAGEQGVNVYVSEFSPVPGTPIWERCVELCELPIGEEPLYQNNTLLPMAWEGFTRADLAAVKECAADYRRAVSRREPPPPRSAPPVS